MKDDFEHSSAPGMSIAPAAEPDTPPVVRLDVALYERYLSDGGMTDDQKREFLEALWSIVVGFVDLGFGIDPIRQANPLIDLGGPFPEAQTDAAVGLVHLTDSAGESGINN